MGKEIIRKIEDKDLIRHKLFHEQKSSLAKYKELVVGDVSLFEFIKYELLTTLLGPIPGALGLVLRKIFYPYLFKRIGKGVVFGRSIVIRHPNKIELGNRVVIDDYCLIDGRGAGDDGVIIDDDTIISRGVIIQSKVGPIYIGESTNVGAVSAIVSMGGVYIGEMVTIAAGCFISGGAYSTERGDDSGRNHGKHTKGPIHLDKKSRYAMGVIVLDGVHVEEGCFVGAGSVVITDLPKYSIAAGVPAKVLRDREEIRNEKAVSVDK
jgi:acetyltransferase-like isoleucine patch superfamily enzyme